MHTNHDRANPWYNEIFISYLGHPDSHGVKNLVDQATVSYFAAICPAEIPPFSFHSHSSSGHGSSPLKMNSLAHSDTNAVRHS